jgi:hypothetical protein
LNTPPTKLKDGVIWALQVLYGWVMASSVIMGPVV